MALRSQGGSSSEFKLRLPPPTMRRRTPGETEQDDDNKVLESVSGAQGLAVLNGSTVKADVVTLQKLLEMSYPEYHYSEIIDGVTVTLEAKAGVLPEFVEAEIINVTDNVKDALTETMDGDMSTPLAFDITLKDSNGDILDNESWIGYVMVSFSGEAVKEAIQGEGNVAVVCIDTEVDAISEILSPVDINYVELINEVAHDSAEGIGKVDFKAEHFTIYATGNCQGGQLKANKYPVYRNSVQQGGEEDKSSHEVNLTPEKDTSNKFNCQVKKYNETYGKRSEHYVRIKDGYNLSAWEIAYVRCDKYGDEISGEIYYRVVYLNEDKDFIGEESVLKNSKPVKTPKVDNLEGWYLEEQPEKVLNELPEITEDYARKNSSVYDSGANAIVFVAKKKQSTGKYKIDVDKDIIKIETAAGKTFITDRDKDAEEKIENDKDSRYGVTVGDIVTYRVKIKNEEGKTLRDIYISDFVNGTEIDLGNNRYFASLDNIIEFTYTHTVTEEDIQNAKHDDDDCELDNKVEVRVGSKTKTKPDDTDSEDVDIQRGEGQSYSLTVKHVYYNADNEQVNVEVEHDAVSTTPGAALSFLKKNVNEYVFASTYVEGMTDTNPSADIVEGTMPRNNVTITFNYDEDKIGPEDRPDETADKYQTTVVFEAVNGTVDEMNTVKRVVTLKEKGILSENGSYTFKQNELPVTAPGEGYTAPGSWNKDPLNVKVTKTQNKKFTITFSKPVECQATVKYFFDEIYDAENDLSEMKEVGSTWEIIPENTKTYNKKNYVLEKVMNNGLKIGTNPESNVIEVYYALDEIGTKNPNEPDNIPDKYQTTVVFKAVNGTVDGENQIKRVVTLKDKQGNPSETGFYKFDWRTIPKTAPLEGYVNIGTWDKNPLFHEVKKGKNELFIISFCVKYVYKTKVEYYFDKVHASEMDSLRWRTYDSIFTITPMDKRTYNRKNYVLDDVENNGLRVGIDPQDNIIKVYYALDENNDKIADKYQMTVTFKAVNGTVDGETQIEKVVTLRDADEKPAEGGSYLFTEDKLPKTEPAEGYTTPGVWDKNPLIYEVRKGENDTFIITFDNKAKYLATVKCFFDGVYDAQYDMSSEKDFESPFQVEPKLDLEYNGKNYVFEKMENNGLLIGANPEENVVNVYYALDEIGTDDPNGPDNIPDKWQIRFDFVAGNGGSLSGILTEVYTIYETEWNQDTNEISTKGEAEPVYPKALVEASPESGYSQDTWTTNDGTVYATTNAIRETSFNASQTFTMNFTRNSSSGGNPSTGSGTSSGSRGTGSGIGGPGVIINPEEVPLAPLPEVLIDEEGVPLGLPKTGEATNASKMILFVSAIMMAAYAIVFRREEEEIQ